MLWHHKYKALDGRGSMNPRKRVSMWKAVEHAAFDETSFGKVAPPVRVLQVRGQLHLGDAPVPVHAVVRIASLVALWRILRGGKAGEERDADAGGYGPSSTHH